jgi:hypothetical protein
MKEYVNTLEYLIALYSEENLFSVFLDPTPVMEITFQNELGEKKVWTWATGVVDVGVYRLNIIDVSFDTLSEDTVYIVEKNVLDYLQLNIEDYESLLPDGVEIISPKFIFSARNPTTGEVVKAFKYFDFLTP